MFCLQTAIQNFVERTAVVFFGAAAGRMVWLQIERLLGIIRTHCWTLKTTLVSMNIIFLTLTAIPTSHSN